MEYWNLVASVMHSWKHPFVENTTHQPRIDSDYGMQLMDWLADESVTLIGQIATFNSWVKFRLFQWRTVHNLCTVLRSLNAMGIRLLDRPDYFIRKAVLDSHLSRSLQQDHISMWENEQMGLNSLFFNNLCKLSVFAVPWPQWTIYRIQANYSNPTQDKTKYY